MRVVGMIGTKGLAMAHAGLMPGHRRAGTSPSSARRPRSAAAPEQRTRLAEPGASAFEAGIGSGIRRARYSWLKRTLDLAVALAGAIFYLPIIGIAGLAIQLVDPGPVFYGADRYGHRGRRIRVWKLRTMYRDADAQIERYLAANSGAREEWNRHFKLRRDPRILPWIGGFLRRSSIDELPQIWNVIRGDMTLVGPRPLSDCHIDAFDSDFRRERQSVVPGLTGLWQVTVRSDADTATIRRLDLYYVRNWSLSLDLEILLRTCSAVLTGKGAR